MLNSAQLLEIQPGHPFRKQKIGSIHKRNGVWGKFCWICGVWVPRINPFSSKKKVLHLTKDHVPSTALIKFYHLEVKQQKLPCCSKCNHKAGSMNGKFLELHRLEFSRIRFEKPSTYRRIEANLINQIGIGFLDSIKITWVHDVLQSSPEGQRAAV